MPDSHPRLRLASGTAEAPGDEHQALTAPCSDQFVAYSLNITYAYSHGGPGCATARPGYSSSDDTARCTASSRLVLSAQQRGNLLCAR
jgi:hypothetical protein